MGGAVVCGSVSMRPNNELGVVTGQSDSSQTNCIYFLTITIEIFWGDVLKWIDPRQPKALRFALHIHTSRCRVNHQNYDRKKNEAVQRWATRCGVELICPSFHNPFPHYYLSIGIHDSSAIVIQPSCQNQSTKLTKRAPHWAFHHTDSPTTPRDDVRVACPINIIFIIVIADRFLFLKVTCF